MTKPQIELYDTTLRDGSQAEGVSFSLEDKLRIAEKLDELGVKYIEGGWPGSNPKDVEFFARAKGLKLKQAVIAAFGSTRRANIAVEKDANLQELVKSGAKVCTLVGKSWDVHVTQVLETSLEENLNMIADSIAYLKAKGRTVFFDAEHYFDGYRANPDYALRTIQVAAQAGADCVVLCDTNGGSLPSQVKSIVEATQRATKARLGIHAHNDSDTAVANSLAAVEAGITQVQGTINGIGERCGNANLTSIIPNLKLKMGLEAISAAQLQKLTEVSRYVTELANLSPNQYQPFVGASAFSHKGGLHASAEMKVEGSYQHIKPELVGNAKRVVVSELSGRSNLLYKAGELHLDLKEDEAKQLLGVIKEQESKGFQYEGAEASYELLVRRVKKGYKSPFELVDFIVIVETLRRGPSSANGGAMLSEATVKVKVGHEVMHTVAEGNGPVNALDAALRKGLAQFYPDIHSIKLADYKVRIVSETQGTASTVRVLIESTDGRRAWNTVGCSTNIIEASWLALSDALEYWLIHRNDR